LIRAHPHQTGGASSQRSTICLVGLIAGGHSGIPRYAAMLVNAMDAVSPSFPDLRIRFLTNEAGIAATSLHSIEPVPVRTGGRCARQGPARLLLEHVAARTTTSDVLHFFDTAGPILAPRRPFVTTIHDAAALRGFRRRKSMYKRRLYRWSLQHASAAIAVSETAKNDIVERLDADPSRITVVHSGPGRTTNVPAHDAPRERMVLYVGNIGANKNLPLLIRAFHLTETDARLVIAGRPGDGFRAVRTAIEEGPRHDQIELRTNVSDDDVEHLYQTAAALVLPSSYEGFGFTPLEAMARGCPVIESDIPALREISGDGALLVSPNDENGWAHAIRRVLDEPALQAELRARGAQTVSRFSWERTARDVLAILRAVSHRSRSGR
jgi:glycosyltransferase involved in cell wall biosynthesis